jgi:glycerophosphoryl diester phosphodiesterase
MATRPRRRILYRVLLLLGVSVGTLLIVSNALPGIWFEITKSRAQVLSAGTRSLLSSLDQPLTLSLFFSERETQDVPALQHYAEHVHSILEAFVVEAHGKLVLEVLDPLSSVGEQQRARQDGIESVKFSPDSAPIYFGLAATNSAGASASIPFLPVDPRGEALLDHDLASLIYQLAKPAAGSGQWRYATLGGKLPLVIAHRGGAGLFPEHTIAAYVQAIKDGADCIEPDLVMTKDGVLVDRHDVYLSTTTDVASHPEFASRKRDGTLAAYSHTKDWYVSDFTLAELKTLRAVQAFPGRSRAFDGLYTVPTFAEVLDVALAHRTVGGAPVCVYPEAKWPAFHESLGLDIGGEILRVLMQKGLDTPGSPIFIQSFEPLFLKTMATRTQLPLMLLAMTQCDLDAAMKIDGAPFWNVLGAMHQMLFDWRGRPTSVIHDAHLRGIVVHSWTYRDDAPFWGEDTETSMKRALALGLDGFFTDFPLTGYRLVNAMQSRPSQMPAPRPGSEPQVQASLIR